MKSSKRRSFYGKFFAGLTLALVLGFALFNQSGYKMRVLDEETVLGASSATTTAKKTLKGSTYQCKRTNCDLVKNIDSWEQNAADKSQDDLCESVRDSDDDKVCYWATGYFTTHQCNVDKGIYRNSKYRNQPGTKGGRNQALSGNDENIVYYDCTKLAPTITVDPYAKCDSVGDSCCFKNGAGVCSSAAKVKCNATTYRCVSATNTPTPKPNKTQNGIKTSDPKPANSKTSDAYKKAREN